MQGANSIGNVGVVMALEEEGVLCHIKRFAGSSMGALVAALVALVLARQTLTRSNATPDSSQACCNGTGFL